GLRRVHAEHYEKADVARKAGALQKLSASAVAPGRADDVADFGVGNGRRDCDRSRGSLDLPLRATADVLAGAGLRRVVSRHAAADPALPDLLRVAECRRKALAARRRRARPGAELRGLGGRELSRRHRSDSARTDGGGVVLGNDARTIVATRDRAAGDATGDPAG